MSGWGRRKLNRVSWARNPQGDLFVFGLVGSGKTSTVVTLAYRKTEAGIKKAAARYRKYVGIPMNDVPREG